MELDPILQQEDDPITATYPVFINPSLPSNRRLLVLQHPNRTDDTPRAPPTEIRLKTKAGMVEVDMPLDSSTAYDKEKGLHWGRSLHSSTQAKSGGSHGLAGGFGFGAVQQRGGRTKREEEDDALLDWNEAVRQGKVLTTQTLGGQYPDANDVQYMVGVFQGSLFPPSYLLPYQLLTFMSRKPTPHTGILHCSPPPPTPPHRRNNPPRPPRRLKRQPSLNIHPTRRPRNPHDHKNNC